MRESSPIAPSTHVSKPAFVSVSETGIGSVPSSRNAWTVVAPLRPTVRLTRKDSSPTAKSNSTASDLAEWLMSAFAFCAPPRCTP